MTELINSLKIFASTGTDAAKSHLRNVPLMALGRADSCSESGFNQWRDAMRMVARLPGGLPPEFRIRLWENLADRYLYQKGLDWSRIVAKARGGDANFRHQDIADQIDKDLHRTGCTGFSGAKQVVLKEVLVAYAKWNPSVGYCQGFNMIGAMLLQMTNGDKQLTLKIFVFLIEGVLPQGYFSQGLRGLAVDMAVFRELVKLRKPSLNAHLAQLQNGDDNPPLTDVFTMHWFLTLFIHCLPTPSVLRIWDLVLLEGSEVLLRAALVLWAAIETRISSVHSADEFYSVMGVVTREMLEFGLMEPNILVKCIVSVGPFPFPGLEELRGKHRALISQDTPYKSFFLAKRELDNLKRHYSAIRHRQRGTTLILKNLDPPRSTPGFKSLPAARFSSHSNGQSLGVSPGGGNKKAGNLSPKPKPRRMNSGGKNVILQENNNRNAHVNNKGKSRWNQNQNTHSTKQHQHQQVTLPWDSSTKKPKNFRRRQPSQASASSSYTSSSSSSSTELCDSSTSEDEEANPNPDSIFQEHTKTKDEQMAELDQEGNEKEKILENQFNQTLILSSEPEDENHKNTSTWTQPEPYPAPSPALPIPTISLSTQKSTQSSPEPTPPSPNNSQSFQHPSPIPTTAPDLSDHLECPQDEHLTDIINNTDIQPAELKVIDTNDSQHFLEEMSRLGKSDSFYENLSHRICQLQFQNLRILTTCNTIPDPVIMPNIDYSPLPSPMSPIPPRPLTPNTPSSANLNVPFTRSKLILSPSLNHLSLSTSRRSSISSVTSQPGSPMLSRSPVDPILTPSSRSPSRRPSKSSMSSLEADDPQSGSGHLSKMNSSSLEGDVSSLPYPTTILIGEPTVALEISAKSPVVTPSQDPKDFDLSLPIPSRSSSLNKITHQDALDEGVREAGVHDEGSRIDQQLPLPTKIDITQPPEGDSSAQPQTTEDINAVIRENIAILQRLKLKPAYDDDFFDDDSSSTSFVTEFSDDDPEEHAPELETEAPSHQAAAASVTPSVPSPSPEATKPITVGCSANSPRVSVGRHRPVSRARSSNSFSTSRSTSLQRSSSVCSHCSSKTIKDSNLNATKQKVPSKASVPAPLPPNNNKTKKTFNPFPTARKQRARTTKFGLYS